MKTLTFNRNSWHYRLASKYSADWYEDECKNICSYVKSVFRGMWLVFLLILLSSYLLSSAFVLPGMALYFGGTYGVLDLLHNKPIFAIGFLLIWVFVPIISMGFFCVMGVERLKNNYRYRNYRNHNPGFFSSYWKSIKDKTCLLIEFE